MFQWIITFLSVYETRNFTKTSELLFISQPTVSMQIKKLESLLGVTLFERGGKNTIVPTKSADFLYPRLQKIQAEWTDVVNQVTNAENFRESCTLACSHTCATHIVPNILPKLIKQFPQCDFGIQMMNSHEVVQVLEQNRAEIGFVENRESHSLLERKTLLQDELVLAGDPQSEFWLLREEQSGLRFFNDYYLKKNNLLPKIISVNSNDTIVSLLKEGVGRTILSRLSLVRGIPYQMIEEPNHREFYLMYRKNLGHSYIQSVAAYIQELFQETSLVDFLEKKK